VAGPAGPKGSASQSPAAFATAGSEYRLVTPPFTAPANATCVVTSSVQASPATTSAPDAEVFFRNAVKRNGVDDDDRQYGHYLTNDGTPGLQPSATRSSVLAIAAGQTIQFGVFFGRSASWAGAETAVATSYICS
jgi:hypothetical protein